jgi:hypothetical protein
LLRFVDMPPKTNNGVACHRHCNSGFCVYPAGRVGGDKVVAGFVAAAGPVLVIA